jgi:Type I restriction-modification system methyltransferase subunit
MRTQEPRFRGFDVVLTNPPFAGDVGCEYADAYELARGHRVERDVLFLERCVELLRPQGRLAIVLPHNKVGAERWAYLRAWLLERVAVVAVVGLGRNTFRPHTSQKACVVIGCKRPKPTRHFRDEEILFFISERDGKDHRGRLAFGPDGESIDHDLAQATPLVRRRFELLQGGA